MRLNNSLVSFRCALIVAAISVFSIVIVFGMLGSRRAHTNCEHLRPVIAKLIRTMSIPNSELAQLAEDTSLDFEKAGVNDTNLGAEVLFKIAPFVFTSDTDGDGLREAADENGNPLIFLKRRGDVESIRTYDGAIIQVCAPPNCSGIYIASLDCHYWNESDRRAYLRDGGK